MKKVLVLSVLCFCLIFIGARAMADTEVEVKNDNRMGTAVEANPTQQINSKSEAQPPQIQELSFIYPPGLFVNAQDFRNVMDLLKFIHENPCPYRWQLEKWADGGSVDVIMSTINEKVSKDANDRIAIFLDIEDFFWIRKRDPKTGNFLKDPATGKFEFYRDTENTYYRGAAVGNAKKNTISLQTLAEMALKAMDKGHNAIEIRARVIAEEVYGKAKGASVGGGSSGIADKVGISVPVMLGVSSSKAGKIALDGIQAELYERKKGVIFEDEAVKIRKQIEKIWDEQKKAAREKKEMDKLRAEVEKKKLQVENEELDKKLEALRNPPPPPSPPAPAPAPPPLPPPPPPPKPEAKKIESCQASLLFEIDDYMPNRGKSAADNYKQAEHMVMWIAANEKEIKKQGGKIVIISGCDESLIAPLKQNSEKYTKDVKSLIDTDKALAELHPYPTDKDYVNPLLGERRSRLTKVYLGIVARRMEMLDQVMLGQVQSIIKSLPVLSSGKDWLVIPNKPLDERNRYSMLAVVIGGPDQIK